MFLVDLASRVGAACATMFLLLAWCRMSAVCCLLSHVCCRGWVRVSAVSMPVVQSRGDGWCRAGGAVQRERVIVSCGRCERVPQANGRRRGVGVAIVVCVTGVEQRVGLCILLPASMRIHREVGVEDRSATMRWAAEAVSCVGVRVVRVRRRSRTRTRVRSYAYVQCE